MRRRRAPDTVAMRRLRIFVPSEWHPEARDDIQPVMPEEDAGLIWEAHRRWCAAREQWAAAHGWPGGDLVRANEEAAAFPDIDCPFDPEAI